MIKKRYLFICFALIIICLSGYIVFDNQNIKTTRFTYYSNKIGEAFDGYKVCFITDFHNKGNYEKVINSVKSTNPDIICIVGDLVDMNTTDFSNAISLVKGLTEITDVYYSYGNHEVWSTSLTSTKKPIVEEMLKDTDVIFMNDSVKTIERDGDKLNIIGYGDDVYDDFDGLFRVKAEQRLKNLYNTLDKTVPSILMLHRAQYFDVAANLGFDVVLSGHLHAGLVNIKGVREYVINKHFITSKYVKGEYKEEDSVMYLSAGLAGKGIIPRIFNTPEICVVEIKSK
ncbi:MAG: metallophosphoesterase [Eubacteriales bacterium]|nr:metallophosphoesterase [Eubacteriales bacterium]